MRPPVFNAFPTAANNFGDSWHHVVLVEEQHPSISDHPIGIRFIDGENARPPKDVGGAQGYAQFLAAIADPRHEEHEQYLTWIGGRFDRTHIDLTAINISSLLSKS